MKKFKVGMVGVGRATAYGHIFANHPDTEVVALCDMNQEVLAQNGKDFQLADNCLFENYEDMLNSDVDIVVLGTPIPFHAEQSIKGLDAGKHVLCEVTASDNIADCQRMVDAVRRSKSKFMLAENCNYMDFTLEWDKYIKSGKIGLIRAFLRIQYLLVYIDELRKLSGNAVFDPVFEFAQRLSHNGLYTYTPEHPHITLAQCYDLFPIVHLTI